MVNHDPEGRPVLFINPDGSVAQKHYYAPNGRLVRTEDPTYSQVPHEAIIPLEFQAGGGFRDLETAPRTTAAKHFHLTVGGYITSGMVYLGLDLSREQQEIFGGAINAAPGKIYDCTVSIAKFLRNLTAGALDGLAHGFTGGLYEGQLAGTYLGAEVDSAAYLTGHVVASFVGPIALSMAAGGIGNPWLLRAAIAVDVMGIIDGIHKRSVLGVVGGLIGLKAGVKAYRNALSSAGRRIALDALESGVEQSSKLVNSGEFSCKIVRDGVENASIYTAGINKAELLEFMAREFQHNDVAKQALETLQRNGVDIVLDFSNRVHLRSRLGLEATESIAGWFRESIRSEKLGHAVSEARIFLDFNRAGAKTSLEFYRNVVSTVVHEAQHARDYYSGLRYNTQWGEFRAFAAETLYRKGRMPNSNEARRIWKMLRETTPYKDYNVGREFNDL